MIHQFIIASNPFFAAYSESDILGKLIFISLIALSICSWIVIFHKTFMTKQARSNAVEFQKTFYNQKSNPLNLNVDNLKQKGELHPYRSIYTNLKKSTLELLNKNRKDPSSSTSYLSAADIEYVEGHLVSTINAQVKMLEKNLFILPTVVSLGPFLGLLGTVWGIITTFSEMTGGPGGNQAFLSGLSLALATTVLGLVDAIPALIGYNYLKNDISDFEGEMGAFAHQALASIELQYRKVDVD